MCLRSTAEISICKLEYMRYLAIDYGKRRTGLAICDPMEIIVSPLAVIEGGKGLLEKIVEIVESEEVKEIVIGLPLNMDGTEGGQAKQSRELGNGLAKRLDMPIHFQDERLSSYKAGEKLKTFGLGYKKRKERLDALAAAEILMSLIEGKKGDCNLY